MRKEKNGAANIHGIVKHVEGEASDLVCHQNAKVIAEEGAYQGQQLRIAKAIAIPVMPSCRNEVVTKVRPTAAAESQGIVINAQIIHSA